jgi:hypothetical protein
LLLTARLISVAARALRARAASLIMRRSRIAVVRLCHILLRIFQISRELMPPSLKRLLAERALEKPPSDAWVEWAVAQLSAGQDTPHLRILAGERAPYGFGEMSALLDRILGELGIQPPPREAAIHDYASELVSELVTSHGENFEPLQRLRDLAIDCKYPSALHDFYLLAFAAEDLIARGDQHYWEGATSANIAFLITDRASLWLAADSRSGTA